MFESFSVIASLPSAIDASLNIIQKLRNKHAEGKVGNGSVLNEFTEAASKLKEGKILLAEFAVSFDELEAWKQIHHISNTLRNNFKKSFSHVSRAADSHYFERKIYNISVKDDILDDINSLYDERQAGTLLKKYMLEKKLYKYTMSLKDADVSNKEWHIRTEELISDTESAAKAGTPQLIFDSLRDLSRYINLSNTLADDSLIKGISKYHQVVNELRKALG
jgi:hypothetical protein